MSECFHECPTCGAIHRHEVTYLDTVDEFFKPCERPSCKVKFAQRQVRVAEQSRRIRQGAILMKAEEA